MNDLYTEKDKKVKQCFYSLHNATKEKIDEALDKIQVQYSDIAKEKRDDEKNRAVIFVFYSGHGGIDEDITDKDNDDFTKEEKEKFVKE